MLDVFRNSAKGTAGKVIVGLIVITFVLFGAESIISIAGNSAPANVNGDDISERDYQRLLSSRQNELTQQFGAEMAAQLANSSFLKDEIIESLVSQKLQAQLTESLKFGISEEQVLETLTDIPAFQLEGQFNQDIYLNVLSANGFTHQSFIDAQKAQLALSQMQAGVANSSFSLNKAVQKYAGLIAQQRTVTYKEFNASDFIEDVVITDEELDTYYQENQDKFLSEEQVKVNYLTVSLVDLAATIEVTEDEIQVEYSNYTTELSAKETREISHILFSDGDDNEAEAQAVLARLENGEAFSDLAAELSDDPGSAEFGGSLGALIPDVYVPEFYSAAIALSSEGEVSGLVATQYGVHLIKLDSLSSVTAESLEDKRSELVSNIQNRLARDEMLIVESQLSDEAFASDDLSEVAESFKVDIIESDWILRSSNEGVFSESNVVQAAFSTQVIDEELISNVVRLSNGDLLTLQKVAYQPEDVRSFDDVINEVTESITSVKSAELMNESIDSLIAASEVSGEGWSDELTVNRENTELPPEVVNKAFELAAADSGVSLGKTEGSQSAYAVAVVEVINADATAEQIELAENFAAQISGGSQYQILYNQTRESADISIRR